MGSTASTLNHIVGVAFPFSFADFSLYPFYNKGNLEDNKVSEFCEFF